MGKQLGKSILIVDDEIQILDLLEAFVSDSFQTLDRATKFAEARIKLSANRYDYIVLDFNLGTNNGGELLDFIKQSSGQNKNALILFVSAHFNDEFLQKYGGEIERLSKPFTRDQLLKKLVGMKKKLLQAKIEASESKDVELDEQLKALLDKE